jgi:hypothetical protein
MKAVAIPVLSHRIVLRSDVASRGYTSEQAIRDILAIVPVPAGR